MWGDWAALALLLVLSTRFVIGGATDAPGVSISTSVLRPGQSGAGLILGAGGIGGILGASVAAIVTRRKSLVPVVIGGGVLLGAGVAMVAFFDRLAPAMSALALAGMGGALLIVGGRTLLQRVTDDRVLARVFAVQESTSLLGVALGTAVSPLLIHQFSADGAHTYRCRCRARDGRHFYARQATRCARGVPVGGAGTATRCPVPVGAPVLQARTTRKERAMAQHQLRRGRGATGPART